MMTNKIHTVLYTGVTGDLETRDLQHKRKETKGFTARYNATKLVYFEHTDDVRSAIMREKKIKGWTRKKKDALVASINPEWNDLSEEWRKPIVARRGILRFAQDDNLGGM